MKIKSIMTKLYQWHGPVKTADILDEYLGSRLYILANTLVTSFGSFHICSSERIVVGSVSNISFLQEKELTDTVIKINILNIFFICLFFIVF